MADVLHSEPTIRGVWCASVTPLQKDGSVDVGRLASHVAHLIETGCHGVALFGSTGEGNSFSVSERVDTLRALGGCGVSLDRVLIGAGACCTTDVVRFAEAVRETGARGLLLHPPFYYRDATDDGLFAFLGRVVDGMKGSPVPVLLYHFPQLVGVGFSEDLIARLLDRWPGVFAGIKDSSGDLERMRQLAADHPGFAVLAGTERLLLPLLRSGGAGCLTATVNLTAALCRRVCDDRLDEDHERLVAERRALEKAPFVPGIKGLLAKRTGHAGWSRVRPPLVAADAGMMTRLSEAINYAWSDESA